jgi:hypothetical protein
MSVLNDAKISFNSLYYSGLSNSMMTERRRFHIKYLVSTLHIETAAPCMTSSAGL